MTATPVRTQHGYEIVRSRFIEGDNFQVDGWVIVAHLPHNDVHPYVVWWMREDNLATVGGDYCKTLEEAIARWEVRR